MLITLKHNYIVEKFVKKYGEKHSFIELTCAVGAHWNCLNDSFLIIQPKHMFLVLKRTISMRRFF